MKLVSSDNIKATAKAYSDPKHQTKELGAAGLCTTLEGEIKGLTLYSVSFVAVPPNPHCKLNLNQDESI